jgi:hypothetical protein
MKYAYEHYKMKYIICLGTDTYLNIPRLLLYLNNFDHNECLYIGGHGGERWIGSREYYFHAGGPGFIITRNCLTKIYDRLSTLMEHWTTVCYENNVQYLISACDVAMSYYLQQPGIDVKLVINNEAFFHCNYNGMDNGSPCHMNQINMGDIIACHTMSIADFWDFTEILNNNNHFC